VKGAGREGSFRPETGTARRWRCCMVQATSVQELATRLSTTPGVVLKVGKTLGLDLRGAKSVIPADRVTEVIRKTAEYLAAAREGD